MKYREAAQTSPPGGDKVGQFLFVLVLSIAQYSLAQLNSACFTKNFSQFFFQLQLLMPQS